MEIYLIICVGMFVIISLLVFFDSENPYSCVFYLSKFDELELRHRWIRILAKLLFIASIIICILGPILAEEENHMVSPFIVSSAPMNTTLAITFYYIMLSITLLLFWGIVQIMVYYIVWAVIWLVFILCDKLQDFYYWITK